MRGRRRGSGEEVGQLLVKSGFFGLVLFFAAPGQIGAHGRQNAGRKLFQILMDYRHGSLRFFLHAALRGKGSLVGSAQRTDPGVRELGKGDAFLLLVIDIAANLTDPFAHIVPPFKVSRRFRV